MNSKKKNLSSNTKKGGNFLNTFSKSIISIDKRPKNYNVHIPGSKFLKSFSSSSNPQSQLLNVIFNRRVPNQSEYDITNISPNNPISSKFTNKEPYIFLNSDEKYLFVIYREKKKKDVAIPELKLHFLAGYLYRTPTKIFPYVEPKIKPNKKQKFIVKLYKYPINDKLRVYTKIENVVNRKEAYQEFIKYVSANNLQEVKKFIYVVIGDSQSGFNLLNMA